MESFFDAATRKIKTLHDSIWERRPSLNQINEWLENFSEEEIDGKSERTHALHLLSHFIYFGNREIRELLKATYRDSYKYPIVSEIRRNNANTIDEIFLEKEFLKVQDRTRFLGVGNPSESGSHLLYFFRQENALSKDLFISSHQIFKTDHNFTLHIADMSIEHYVFLDDFCGSGAQIEEYLRDSVDTLKQIEPSCKVWYLPLFATSQGLQHVRQNVRFDYIQAIFTLDESYRCFHDKSRFFNNKEAVIDKAFSEKMCKKHGKALMESLGQSEDTYLGFSNSQLLIGFHHNTPDNTLPIIWFDEYNKFNWIPIFRRYPKAYWWGAL